MHGGAVGSGAPRGNTNALKSGIFSKRSLAERKQAQEFIRQARKFLEALE
jgi:hypothetical protein